MHIYPEQVFLVMERIYIHINTPKCKKVDFKNIFFFVHFYFIHIFYKWAEDEISLSHN